MCPHCGDTQRYTDALDQVRCTTCFNVLNDQAPAQSDMELQDLEAPMIIGTHTYPQPIITKYNHTQ